MGVSYQINTDHFQLFYIKPKLFQIETIISAKRYKFVPKVFGPKYIFCSTTIQINNLCLYCPYFMIDFSMVSTRI